MKSSLCILPKFANPSNIFYTSLHYLMHSATLQYTRYFTTLLFVHCVIPEEKLLHKSKDFCPFDLLLPICLE